MHEIIFANTIINQVKNKENVLGLDIELGELVGITKEELKDAIEKITGWQVNIVSKESKINCSCGYEGRAKIREKLHDLVIFHCPHCRNNTEPLEGHNIKIKKIRYRY